MKNMLIFSLILISAVGHAQNNTSGTVITAPNVTIPAKDIGIFLATRLHTLNLDSQLSSMQPGNKKNFVAGFTAEGALAYQYEIDGEKISDWNDVSKNAGGQVLPYSVQILKDGSKKISVSAFAFRNMNAVDNTSHMNLGSGWDLFDRLDILTVTWDQGMSFNNLRTFDVDAINTRAKFLLAGGADDLSDKNKDNYLALQMGAKGGIRQTNITNSVDYGYSKDNTIALNGQYSTGLELNLQSKKKHKARLNVQSNYVGGSSGVRLINNELNEESKIREEWLGKIKAYQLSPKGYYGFSEADYIKATGEQKPTFSYPEDTPSQQTLIRAYGHLNNKVDVSFPMALKSGHPMRLGVGFDVNVVFFDKAVNHQKIIANADRVIDFKNHYNQTFQGRLYLNF